MYSTFWGLGTFDWGLFWSLEVYSRREGTFLEADSFLVQLFSILTNDLLVSGSYFLEGLALSTFLVGSAEDFLILWAGFLATSVIKGYS
jgi:hypothetical protein